MTDNNTHEEIWEDEQQNKELRKVTSKKKANVIKKTDMVNKKKYDHIDHCVTLLDKIRSALHELSVSDD